MHRHYLGGKAMWKSCLYKCDRDAVQLLKGTHCDAIVTAWTMCVCLLSRVDVCIFQCDSGVINSFIHIKSIFVSCVSPKIRPHAHRKSTDQMSCHEKLKFLSRWAFPPLFWKIQSHTDAHGHMIYFCFAKCFLYSGKCSLDATALHFTAAASLPHLQSSHPLFFSGVPQHLFWDNSVSDKDCWQTHCARLPSLTSHCTLHIY